MIISAQKYQNPKTQLLSRQLNGMGPFFNIFNPSHVFFDDLRIIAFRAIHQSNQSGPIESFIAFYSGDMQNLKVHSLSEYVKQWNVEKAADPKLFKRNSDGSVWLTFNTGYVKSGNELYIMQVYPRIGKPIRCLFAGRANIEKNWAFFFDGNRLKAYYSLAPFRVISSNIPNEHSDTITFTDDYLSDSGPQTPLSIGSQIVEFEHGHGLIAHRKIHLFRKRLYYGVPVNIRLINGEYVVKICSQKLIHNYRSLLGSRIKHNRNLISCAYFSGLEMVEDQVIVGYGVNDVSFSFAAWNLHQLWK